VRSIDLLINADWVIPIEPAGACLPQHSVAVDGGLIVDLLPQAQARQSFIARQTVDLPHHVLLPGLVNAHCHGAMTLLRGIADDLPLMRWLQEAIWPSETQHMSHAFVRDGTLLAAEEMLRGGITTCNDMYFHPDAAAEAFDLAGMRAVVGMTVIGFPTPYATDADDYLRKGLAARERWHQHPLLHFALAPHAPYTVGDEDLVRCASLAAELDLPVHMHIHETKGELDDAVTRTGMRPLERLARLGLLGSNLIAVHAVHLSPAEIGLLATHGCAVAHCPTSNMKLASGIAPAASLIAAGVAVGLGSDGAASNNRLDLFQEMRHASLLAKVSCLDPTVLPAHRVLQMATLDGARALGMEQQVGSLRPGKAADLCAVSLASLETRPCYDPISQLIYVAGREHVSHVWVAGMARVFEGNVLRIYNTDLSALASLWQNKLGHN
jgi:5-methylthioadenosine/S-adenosylhomocysteine deaminase